jgi:hypothetical protein
VLVVDRGQMVQLVDVQPDDTARTGVADIVAALDDLSCMATPPAAAPPPSSRRAWTRVSRGPREPLV